MKSYIEFKEIHVKTKTKKFEVISKTDGSKLGEIKWQPSYRSYAFFVTSEVTSDYERWGFATWVADTKIFDPKCLDEISAFIKALMAERNKA